MVTRILTASPENHAATAAHGFTVIGLKEMRRRQALDVEVGDRIVLLDALRAAAPLGAP